ncbi:uncharacterized protein BCR38DRAFT_332112 [Pseudomassariella vexata]|uniref:MOZ protein represents a chromatin-associated acetyltransferase n=1 Tax=Pseudomassariella vexata TaxID=1141098 RepID=A0A1Y2EDL2_9PEZI|nr:uncharacterized protein BCR38DRAFT_332112 [Pseudomassariella vexata]ORY69669.1 hypothetical protein BCR38DRAFT_332112 [Pseudomassariella vexata]
MPAQRLTFLYPHLYRSLRLGESAAQTAKSRCRKSPNSHCSGHYAVAFSTSARRRKAVFERHGKAVEPQPASPNVVKLPQPGKEMRGSKGGPKDENHGTPEFKAKDDFELDSKKAVEESPETEESPKTEKPTPPSEGSGSAQQARPTPQQVAAEEKMQSSGPMEAVLHMPPPSQFSHPHISTPPYIHHFDTYGLVKQLEGGGYTEEQAITVMKAVRTLLAQNLGMAQTGLVSKSDVDNETYLFRAACSELSTEVDNNRKAADEQMRQQRTLLQHEVDILGQRLSQDLMTLKDDVKGMFNDRRMAVREEQRRTESAIQQVNLEISVTLNSDAKSEIEGLRWVLIRRSVLGILFMVVLTLGTIRYTTYIGHEQQKELEEQRRQEEEKRRNNGRVDHAPAPDAAEILAAN